MNQLVTGIALDPRDVDQFKDWVLRKPEIVASWVTIAGRIGIIVTVPDEDVWAIWCNNHISELQSFVIEVRTGELIYLSYSSTTNN